MRLTTADLERIFASIIEGANLSPQQIASLRARVGLPAAPVKREGSGYWTNYGVVAAAAAGGRAIRFAYMDERGVATTRHAIPLGGVLTGQEGQHYVKTIDLGKDGPRSFRIERMLDVQDAGVA